MSDSDLQVNDLPDFLDEDVEEVPNLTSVSAGWPLGVAHGYCKGRLAVILHISLRGGESEVEKFCATYYRSLEVVKGGVAGYGSDEAELPASNVLHGQREQPVLVRIVEFPDERKESRQFMVSSVVRLRSLNSCLRGTAQLREPPISFGDKSGLRIRDRELQSPAVWRGIGATVSDSNAIHNVIESGSEVMNTIPCDQAPAFKRRRFSDFNANAVAATIQIAFSGENVRVSVNPRLKFGLESIEMFLGTTYLEEAASEFRTDHAVYATSRSTGVSS